MVSQPPRAEALLAEALERGREGPPLLVALLALLGSQAEVRFDATLETAALRFEGDRFAVLIGTRAVERGSLSADDLLYLIAHELCHLVRDEHRLPSDRRRASAANIAADAINDAWLTGPTFGGFFSPTTALPARRLSTHPLNGLMLPLPAAEALVIRRGRGGPVAAEMISCRLYDEVIPPVSGGLAPYRPEMWAATHRVLQVGGRDATLSSALGTELVLALFDQLPIPPEPESALLSEMLSTEAGRRLLDEMKRAFDEARDRLDEANGKRRRSRGKERGRGFGPAGDAQDVQDVTVRRARAEAALERFLRRVAVEVDAVAGAWSPVGPRGVACERGALVTARSACEFRAGLKATPMAERSPTGGERPAGVELYLDASGSMEGDLAVILASLVSRCPDLLGPMVRVFSVGVRVVTARALREGRLPSDGGTSFEALAADLLARRVTHAVVISDGEASPLRGDLVAALTRQRTKVAMVFPGAIGRSPLDALSPPTWRLGLGLSSVNWGGRA